MPYLSSFIWAFTISAVLFYCGWHIVTKAVAAENAEQVEEWDRI